MSGPARLDLTIVIITWNSLELTRRCLRSLEECLGAGAAEVIVVDNGSSDGSERLLGAEFPWIRLLRNPRNRGVAPARNQGLRAAAGAAVMLLDCDTVVQPGAVERLLAGLEDPAVGVVGPRLISPAGELQYTCRRLPTLFGKLARRSTWRGLRRWAVREELRNWDHREPRAVDYVIGACQLIRRATLEQVGLLDERIFYGPEDVDFCLRAGLAGWHVLYQPSSCIVHDERRVTRGRGLSRLTALHLLGLLYYFAKHRYLLSDRAPAARLAAARAHAPVAG